MSLITTILFVSALIVVAVLIGVVVFIQYKDSASSTIFKLKEELANCRDKHSLNLKINKNLVDKNKFLITEYEVLEESYELLRKNYVLNLGKQCE